MRPSHMLWRELDCVSGLLNWLQCVWNWSIDKSGIGNSSPIGIEERFYTYSLSKHPAAALHTLIIKKADRNIHVTFPISNSDDLRAWARQMWPPRLGCNLAWR